MVEMAVPAVGGWRRQHKQAPLSRVEVEFGVVVAAVAAGRRYYSLPATYGLTSHSRNVAVVDLDELVDLVERVEYLSAECFR